MGVVFPISDVILLYFSGCNSGTPVMLGYALDILSTP
jgi:hypothetical protein